MKYSIISDPVLENNRVNEIEFNNMYLLSLYDSTRFVFVKESYDAIRQSIMEDSIQGLGKLNFNIYLGEFYLGDKISSTKKTYYFIRLSDNKISPLYKIDSLDSINACTSFMGRPISNVMFEKYIEKKNGRFYISVDKNPFSYMKANTLIYLYSLCH